MDWSGCSVVESVPGRCGGVPVLRHTRMPMYLFMDNFEAGVSAEEFAEDFDLDLKDVLEAYAFTTAHLQRAVA